MHNCETQLSLSYSDARERRSPLFTAHFHTWHRSCSLPPRLNWQAAASLFWEPCLAGLPNCWCKGGVWRSLHTANSKLLFWICRMLEQRQKRLITTYQHCKHMCLEEVWGFSWNTKCELTQSSALAASTWTVRKNTLIGKRRKRGILLKRKILDKAASLPKVLAVAC